MKGLGFESYVCYLIIIVLIICLSMLNDDIMIELY